MERSHWLQQVLSQDLNDRLADLYVTADGPMSWDLPTTIATPLFKALAAAEQVALARGHVLSSQQFLVQIAYEESSSAEELRGLTRTLVAPLLQQEYAGMRLSFFKTQAITALIIAGAQCVLTAHRASARSSPSAVMDTAA